jgi:FdhD protein
MLSTENRPSTVELTIALARSGEVQTRQDTLAVEEPLEIRIGFGPEGARSKKSLSITMRTPGHDFELAVGFLYTEGLLPERAAMREVAFCGPSRNVVRVELAPGTAFDMKRLERHFYTSSSCGVCGKSSIEALRVQRSEPLVSTKEFSVPSSLIHDLPNRLRAAQGIFDATGGLHACAVFTADGRLLSSREDVGRHNALDKLIGCGFLEDRLPYSDHVLLVSGRASFELVQKAAMAGFRFFAAVGAPSSLAVELAKENNMTLLGFVREQRFNIYNGSERVLT